MLEKLDSAPPTEHLAEMTTVYDIATVVNAIYQQNIEPTQAGYIPKRIANKLRIQLQGPEHLNYDGYDAYLDMLITIMRTMHIIQLSNPPFQDIKAHYEPGKELLHWSQQNVNGQVRLLLENWQTNYHWMDTVGVNYRPLQMFYIDGKEGRQVCLKHLARCVPGQWYSIESLLDAILQEDPLALRTDRRHMSKTDQRKIKEQKELWMQCYGEIYIGMLDSTLHNLGIITVGYEQERAEDLASNPYAFMLSELGAQVLPTCTEEEASRDKATDQQRTLIVQPNFEILLLQPDLPALYSLLPFTQATQVGVASRLALTQLALLRGLGAGYSIEQIIQLLTDLSAKDLPQNVEYTLHDWARQYQEANVAQVILLEFSDEAAARKFCAFPTFKQHGARQLTPCIVILNGDTNMQTVRNALTKDGIVVNSHGMLASHSKQHQLTSGRQR